MAIVLDANVLVVLVSGDPRKSLADAHVRRWIEADEALHAPALLPYELANGLTRLVVARAFPAEQVSVAWQTVTALPITYHRLESRGEQVIAIARRLRRQSAYDAAYIQLAEDLGAELWSFDGSLVRNARGLGLPVHLIE